MNAGFCLITWTYTPFLLFPILQKWESEKTNAVNIKCVRSHVNLFSNYSSGSARGNHLCSANSSVAHTSKHMVYLLQPAGRPVLQQMSMKAPMSNSAMESRGDKEGRKEECRGKQGGEGLSEEQHFKGKE